jgi:N-acyl-L-homoserine lactone synthetase
MALGVAHTNELSQIQVVVTIMMRRCLTDAGAPLQALHYLQDWLARHPKYRDVRSPN